MEVVVLVIISIVYAIGCAFTYNEKFRQSDWFVLIGVAIGVTINALWFYAVKCLDDKDRIYTFGLIWDSIMMITYYLLPILMFGVKLDKVTIIALLLIVIGMVLLKVK